MGGFSGLERNEQHFLLRDHIPENVIPPTVQSGLSFWASRTTLNVIHANSRHQ